MKFEDIPFWLGLISILGGLFSIIWGIFVMRKSPSQDDTIEHRVRRLTTSLEEATALISNIESEIRARSKLATQLQQDIDQYNKLVEVKKPEVEAIAQLLRGELRREGRVTFWKGVAINFIFFVLGATASFLITFVAK
jgi:hypothetical protein